MGNLTKRILTAMLILPPVLSVVFFAPPVYISAIAVVLAGIGGFEFANITFDKEFSVHRFFASSLSAMIAIGIGLSVKTIPNPNTITITSVMFITVAALCFAVFMFTSKDLAKAFRTASFCITGAMYTGGLFGAVVLISLIDMDKEVNTGRWWVFLLMASVILNDTFAYATGRLIGKRKLNKTLSPNKTWEGSIGGIVGSVGAVLVVRQFFLNSVELLPALGLGIILGIVSQVGDLMESFIKRSCNVKDSGNIFPGHGGVLDRFDGLMLGAPIVLVFTMFW